MRDTVLIVGSGAREHAIAETLARSPQKPDLLCYSNAHNPGIERLARRYTTGSLIDGAPIAAFAKDQSATLAIIGPEAPLAAGVADALWATNIPTVGPTQSLARIESSKSFARDLLATHNIPGNPTFERIEPSPDALDQAQAILHRLGNHHVIKDDGLAGGKGVKVFGDHLHSLADSLAFCRELLTAGHPFVVEEKLEGEEFSLLSFSDGTTLRHMPAVQDHKRLLEGDRGPNTGGMGSYTSADGLLPFLTRNDILSAQSINQQTAAALHAETGQPYRGILYGGFMATRDGVRLIEYNARFGDPEALNLLTLLNTDLLAICKAITTGTLNGLQVAFRPAASVCKYLVPEGYPDNPRKGDPVILPAYPLPGTQIFLSAVDVRAGELIATGSRTLAVVATAETLAEAEAECERTVATIPRPLHPPPRHRHSRRPRPTRAPHAHPPLRTDVAHLCFCLLVVIPAGILLFDLLPHTALCREIAYRRERALRYGQANRISQAHA